MKRIEWTDALSVGILEIDEQHKKLIGLLNKTSETIENGMPREYLTAAIKESIAFTNIHFTTEEKMFKVARYKDAKKHQEEHQKLIRKAQGFLFEFNNNNLIITDLTMTFFTDWIINHIMVCDMAYTKPLRAAGYK